MSYTLPLVCGHKKQSGHRPRPCKFLLLISPLKTGELHKMVRGWLCVTGVKLNLIRSFSTHLSYIIPLLFLAFAEIAKGQGARCFRFDGGHHKSHSWYPQRASARLNTLTLNVFFHISKSMYSHALNRFSIAQCSDDKYPNFRVFYDLDGLKISQNIASWFLLFPQFTSLFFNFTTNIKNTLTQNSEIITS